VGFADTFGGDALGDADQSDVIAATLGAKGGAFDALANAGHVLGDGAGGTAHARILTAPASQRFNRSLASNFQIASPNGANRSLQADTHLGFVGAMGGTIRTSRASKSVRLSPSASTTTLSPTFRSAAVTLASCLSR